MATRAPTETAARTFRERLVFWLLCLLVVGLVLPFTTELHNICLPQTAASEIIPLAGLLVLILGAVYSGRLRLVRTPLLVPLGVFLTVMLFSALLATWKYSAIEALVRCLAYAATFFLVVQVVRTRRDLVRFTGVVLVVISVAVAYGLMQALGHDFIEWRQTYREVIGTQGGPNFFAAVLVLTLPLAIPLFLAVRSKLTKAVVLVFAAAALTCLLLTQSRAGLLALGAEILGLAFLGFFLYPAHRRKVLFGAMVAFLALVVVVASFKSLRKRVVSLVKLQDGTVRARLTIWKATGKMVAEHPVAGTGLGSYWLAFPAYRPRDYRTDRERYGLIGTEPYHAHSDLLETVAETGLLGLAAYGWFLVAFTLMMVRAWRRTPERYWRLWLAGLGTGATALFLQGLVGVAMRWSGPAGMWWLVLGLAAATTRIAAREARAEELHQETKSWKRAAAAAQEEEQVAFTLPRWTGKTAAKLAATALALLVLSSGVWVWQRMLRADHELDLAKDALAEVVELKVGKHPLSGELSKRGVVEQIRRRHRIAAEAAEKALALNPWEPRAASHLGAALLELGKREEALAALRRAKYLAPHSRRVDFHLCRTLIALERWKEAAAALEAADRLEESRDLFVHFHLARWRARLKEKKEKEAAQELRAILERYPDERNARFYLAVFYARAEKPAEAVREYEELVRRHPGNAEVYYRLARLHAEARRWEKAIESYRKILEISSPKEFKTKALLGLAEALEATGKPREALKTLQEAKKLAPEEPLVHMKLGLVYRALKQLHRALAELSVAKSLAPPRSRLAREAERLMIEIIMEFGSPTPGRGRPNIPGLPGPRPTGPPGPELPRPPVPGPHDPRPQVPVPPVPGPRGVR